MWHSISCKVIFFRSFVCIDGIEEGHLFLSTLILDQTKDDDSLLVQKYLSADVDVWPCRYGGDDVLIVLAPEVFFLQRAAVIHLGVEVPRGAPVEQPAMIEP